MGAQELNAMRLKSLRIEEGYVTLRKLDAGSLQAHKRKNDVVKFFYRYTHENKARREQIGVWDPYAPQNRQSRSSDGRMSISCAVREASELAVKHVTTRDEGGLPALRKAQADESRAEKVKREVHGHTLKMLCEAYVADLKARNKSSWSDVQKELNFHVISAWPELAAKPAAQIETEDIMRILRKMYAANITRTTSKIRSYLHTAFERARTAKRRVVGGGEFEGFHIVHNPVDIQDDAAVDSVKKDPLTIAEIRRYYRLLNSESKKCGFRPQWLSVHLLLGAPRITQLLALKAADVDVTLRELTLYDGKGLRQRSEPYSLPMLDEVRALVKPLAKQVQPHGYVFSLNAGKEAVAARTFSDWAKNLVQSAPPELRIERFQLRRVRSAVETLLSEALVSDEIRGAIQSHGLSGVQRKHYNDAKWRAPKLLALQLLHANLAAADNDPIKFFDVSRLVTPSQ